MSTTSSSRTLGRFRSIVAVVAVVALGSACGEIAVSDGITEVGALNTAGLAVDPTPGATPRADIALDFTADDASDDSEAATLRDGREAPPPPTATTKKKDDDEVSDEDDDEKASTRSEVEDVEEESEVLIARGTYHADVKEGTALKIRDEPEGKQIDRITPDIAVKATGEGTTIDKVTWAQVRPLGDAEWDIGWVVFEHLASGEPDVDPTPTLEPVEKADPTSPPAPTSPPPPPSDPDPDPTAIPEPEADENDKDEGEDQDDEEEGNDDEGDDDDEPAEEPQSDGDSVQLDSLGDTFTVRDDTDLRDNADPSDAEVLAVIRKGADAIVANNTGYRYDGVLYVQVNVVGVLGWVDANQLQAY